MTLKHHTPGDVSDLAVCAAISLTQPWASLMDIGAKRYETRGWRTKYRGWIAIHAAKGFPSGCRELAEQSPFYEALTSLEDFKTWKDLPLGCVLAVVRIVDCVRTEDIRDSLGKSRERSFGDYSDNRYAFVTADLRRLQDPIPMKGALSIWKMPRPITEADLT